MAWTCPDCGRSFGAKGRQHMCVPGLTLEEFFAGARPEAEPIFHAVNDHFRTLDGDLIVDPLARKVLFKNGPTICMLETMTKWVALGFSLRRRLETGRLSRKVVDHQGRYYHVLNLTSAEQVDGEVLDWLTEAFYQHDPQGAVGGSLIPDDIDEEFLGDAI